MGTGGCKPNLHDYKSIHKIVNHATYGGKNTGHGTVGPKVVNLT
jgi:hypothetical protein